MFIFLSLPLSSVAQVFTVTVHTSVPSSAAFCMLASPSLLPLKDEICSRAAPADILFFPYLNLAYPSSLLIFIFGYPGIV